MQDVTCGCLCRRRAVPVMDAILSKPIHAFILFVILSFIAFFFSFAQEIIRGHCPGVVTSGDSVTHKYFHRNEKAGS
jgi:hypothetical protein